MKIIVERKVINNTVRVDGAMFSVPPGFEGQLIRVDAAAREFYPSLLESASSYQVLTLASAGRQA